MREVKIILAFHDVVRIFVAEGKADAQHFAPIADEVEADDFHLITAVERVGRQFEFLLGRDHATAISFVEPFRRCADFAGPWFTAFHPPLEHLHRIGELGFVLLQFRMHRVACVGAAQMR